MRYTPRLEYLMVPAIIVGDHAELIAKDGRRLSARGIHLDRIGIIDEQAGEQALWNGWYRNLSYWKSQVKSYKARIDNEWIRRAENWCSFSYRRLTEQPAYKGKRDRVISFNYKDWDEAALMMLKQLRSRVYYSSLSDWDRWATFTVGNARKRKEKKR